jgi:hypothetical protein
MLPCCWLEICAICCSVALPTTTSLSAKIAKTPSSYIFGPALDYFDLPGIRLACSAAADCQSRRLGQRSISGYTRT